MHPRTVMTLQELNNAEWFCNVGVKDTENAIVLSSWDKAIESCSSIEWHDLCLEATNQYCERLVERSKERFNQWNSVAEIVKGNIKPLIERKIGFFVRNYGLPKPFADMVHWDILHLCMEAEFEDVYPPGFFASQGYWYVKGHFPCGWLGDFPSGTLIVY